MTAQEDTEKTHLVKTVRVFVRENDHEQRREDRAVEQAYIDLKQRAELKGLVIVAFTLSSVSATHVTDVMVIHTITAQVVSKQAIAAAHAAQRFGMPGRG